MPALRANADALLRRLGHTPTMDEIDIWRVADLLVKECGDEAVFRASQRADALLD